MNSKLMLRASVAAAACAALAGCGGGGGGAMTSLTPPVVTMPPHQLDTAAVLAIAQTRTSETSEPFDVNDGLVSVTPAEDETGEPITVNGT